MIECNITASTPVLVAIDISKERHEVLFEVPDKKRLCRVSILNILDEFERLINLLRSFQRPVRVAFEATGNYHRALVFQLGAVGFDIKLTSSVALARTREALHNSWNKNDPKDAQAILHTMSLARNNSITIHCCMARMTFRNCRRHTT
jgi:transposase